MTSIPASRNARAMIFAPRSCPSSPGLAITTLIFRATRLSLRLDPHEGERPFGSLHGGPLLGRSVVLPPGGGRGQRDSREALLGERGDGDAQWAGDRPER